jgi:hypothetical protein
MALTGHNKGFKAEVQQTGPHVPSIHPVIHREALSLDHEHNLHSVQQEAVKIINFLKARPLNSCLFGVLCEEMQAEQKLFLLYLEVRWLSRAEVLKTIS